MAFLLVLKTKSGQGKFRLFRIVLFLYLASNAYVANLLVQSLEKDYPPVAIQDVPKSDVAIVLGGMIQTISLHPGRPELSDSADRLTDAIRLYKAGKVKKILFTGGSGLLFADAYKEADLAKEIFLGLGVLEKDLIWENNSRNTFENAVETKKLLNEKKLRISGSHHFCFPYETSSRMFCKTRNHFFSLSYGLSCYQSPIRGIRTIHPFC